MLTAFGVGEAAISVSGAPTGENMIEHTVRSVGPVSRALCNAAIGTVVGVRGPFGTDWGVGDLAGADTMVVAGGIGLAPLRTAVSKLASPAVSGGAEHLVVLVGARTPDQVVFNDDLRRWREEGTDVEVTVDAAGPNWRGPVGLVTGLLDRVPFDPESTVVLVCGPEVMIRFTARALVDRGVHPERIRVSLERNMQCGVGMCGHCQLGPLLLCRDGPVVTYDRAASLLSQGER
jgi:NAD(P)H-flavin reductase